MFDHFSETAKEVIRLARTDAERSHDNYVGPEHLLYALLKHKHGIALAVLERLGIRRSAVLDDLRLVEREVFATSKALREIPFNRQALEALGEAVEQARHLGAHFVGMEHLLLGLAMTESQASVVLRTRGASAAAVLRETEALGGGQGQTE
jgi:ATP-dependent Clp protease ATP-binding subunit ClpA